MERPVIRHCCIICYKDCDCCGNKSDGFRNEFEFASKAKVLSQFFQMLERHLSSSKKGNEQFGLLFQIFKTNSGLLHSCTDCFGILKSFCDLYLELERTKLLLNWRLGTLTSVMATARRLQSRKRNLKQSLEQVAHSRRILEIKKYLEHLCSSKVSSSVPKVTLKRLPFSSVPVSTSFKVIPTHRSEFCQDTILTSGTGNQELGTNYDSDFCTEGNDNEDRTVKCENDEDDNDEDQTITENWKEPPSTSPGKATGSWTRSLETLNTLVEKKIGMEKTGNMELAQPTDTAHLSSHHSNSEADLNDSSTFSKRKRKTKSGCSPICSKCGTSFGTYPLLKEHIARDHINSSDGSQDRTMITCKICGKDCHSVLDFQAHTELKHHNTVRSSRASGVVFRFQCPDPGCTQLFIELPSLIQHRKQQHVSDEEKQTISVKILFFPSATLPYYSVELGQEYAEVEVPSEVFFCDVEGCEWEPLVSLEDLREHSKLHGEFHCKFCSRVESFAPDLATHELDSHSSKTSKDKAEEETKCPRCDSTFKMGDSSYLSHFFQEHLGFPQTSAVNYSCGICKTFENLKKEPLPVFRHYILQHDSNQPPSQIVRCGQKLGGDKACLAYFVKTKCQEAHHSLWHVGEPMVNWKRFKHQCDICSKVFFKPDVLKKHRKSVHRVHLEVECKHPGCDNKFETEKDAQFHFRLQHLNSHRETPRKCPKCDKTFWHKGNLTSHIKFKHRARATPDIKLEPEPGLEPMNTLDEMNISLKDPAEPKDNVHVPSHQGNHSNDRSISTHDDGSIKSTNPPQPASCQNQRKGKTRSRISQTCSKCGTSFSNHFLLREHIARAHNSNDDGEGRTITCKICGKDCHSVPDFQSHTRLKHHNLVRTPRASGVVFRFLCPDPGCSQLFTELPSLIQYRKQNASVLNEDSLKFSEIISVKILFFPSTTLAFYSVELGQEYATVEVPSEVFWCDVEGCNWEPLFSQEDLWKHSKLHGEFQCNFCTRVENFAPDLAKHELESHSSKTSIDKDEEETKCPRCDSTYKMEDLADARPLHSGYLGHFFEEHLGLPQTSAVNYSCGICKTFENSKKGPLSMFRHYISQHDSNQPKDQIVRCGQKREDDTACLAYFLNRKCREAHHNLWHKGEPIRSWKRGKYQCDICSKVFFKPEILRTHRQGVHKVRFEVECSHPRCDNKFETELDAERHFRLQHLNKNRKTPEVPRKCPECDKTFWNKGNLTAHIKFKHRGTLEPGKRFVCETCGKGFPSNYKLGEHKLTHSGPDSWQFACEICGRKCISKHRLREHKRSHRTEREFVCEICGQDYVHKHNLRLHKIDKHGDKAKNKIDRTTDTSDRRRKKGTKRKRENDDKSDG